MPKAIRLHKLAAALDLFLTKTSDEESWARAFVTANKALRDQVDLDALQAAMENGDEEAALAAIPWEDLDVTLAAQWHDSMLEQMAKGARAAARTTEGGSGMFASFTLKHPRAEEWARKHTADLMTEVVAGSKDAVREAVNRGFSEDRTVSQTAKDIVNRIGLTPRLEAAVERRRMTALASGMSPSQANKLADRYTARMLRYRADMISRTETMRALNQGQLELWRQARDKGLISTNARRVWLLTDDDRLCPLCAAMAGQEAGLEEDFADDLETPPLHPSCRCTTALVNGGREPKPEEGDDDAGDGSEAEEPDEAGG